MMQSDVEIKGLKRLISSCFLSRGSDPEDRVSGQRFASLETRSQRRRKASPRNLHMMTKNRQELK